MPHRPYLEEDIYQAHEESDIESGCMKKHFISVLVTFVHYSLWPRAVEQPGSQPVFIARQHTDAI